ncbi:Uncharacterised protein [BD1-7 clade bacterium]|nr:Uncharacterised protein [BD1-7 clade bacterium]
MDTFGFAVMLMFVFVIFTAPVYCCFKGFSFFKLYMVAFPIMAVFIVLASYWPHFYSDIQLELMGFDQEGLSYEERTINVDPSLRENAEEIHWSGMGVGWPLTAMLWLVFLSPYPSVVWLVALII